MATFLIEKKLIGNLNWRERLTLQQHLAGCYGCRLFEDQSIIINQLLAFKRQVMKTTVLDESFKNKIQGEIMTALNRKKTNHAN